MEDPIGPELNSRALLDAIPDGLLIIDAAGSCVDANRVFCRILRSTREQLIGVAFASLLPPDTAAQSAEILEALSDGQCPGRKFPLIAPSGATVSVEWLWSREYLPGLFLCACAESKHESEMARDGEFRYRTLAESLPQLVWTALPSGECDYLSSQWVSYTGVPEADQLGFRWLSMVSKTAAESPKQDGHNQRTGRSRWPRRPGSTNGRVVDDRTPSRVAAHRRPGRGSRRHLAGAPGRTPGTGAGERDCSMQALYRAGRHTEALSSFRSWRRYLAEELGLDPSPALQRIEQDI